MHPVLEEIGLLKLVPVVAIEEADSAAALGDALVSGGLPCAEVTFRTSAAAEVIGTLADRGDMLVGAGTVLNIDQAKQAAEAGAQFIVSPGFNPKVVAYCLEKGLPVTPGTCTPTDLDMALDFGLEVVKFFPAEAFGGLATLKALSGPYGMLQFIPTGGIGPANVQQYLACTKVLACGGSWMVKKDLISAGQFDRIRQLTAEAVELAATP